LQGYPNEAQIAAPGAYRSVQAWNLGSPGTAGQPRKVPRLRRI
jgi:hypothetical protein